ncbi:MAG: UDP-N-acetylmuramate--L-alanine ligase, partial [Myxococcales bacterium]|nr:UDP-N-acetylmuramate--L-alanine ligase [Myxococcales bacterium]
MSTEARWSRDATYHFIGIGGIGVSAVARVLHEQGVKVQGSDVRESQLTEGLRALGIPVTIGHAEGNVDGADVVVHSTAVPYDNLEREAARARGIPEAHRSDTLGLCLQGREGVGVTGTHGKGTVSAMITHCLITAGLDPTFVIGGLLNNYGTNARAGSGPHAVAEVDESDKSHLNLNPQHVVVNNLEVDHLNFYKGLEDIVGTMAAFIATNPNLKTLALNWDDAGVRDLAGRIDRPFLRYGTEGDDLDFAARDVVDHGDAVSFVAWRGTERLGPVTLGVPGNYNADNAAGAMAIAMGALGLDFATVKAALESYAGLENRFTVRRAGDVVLVKDYLSHPTGMRRVLQSARKMPHNKVWCVFKPYRYTLMRYHGEEYAEAFTGCDEVIITRMYAAEERPLDGIDTPWFVDVLRKGGNSVHYVPENPDVVPYLESRVGPGDLVFFFGGDDFFRM